MSNGKIDGYSVAEQVIAGLFLVGTTAIVVHAIDNIRNARETARDAREAARELTSLSRLSPSRRKGR